MIRLPHSLAPQRPRRARCPEKGKDLGARLALPECREKLKKVHVAVVGGGFAGLMAARRLVQQGIKVTLYEARREVGGRVLSNPNFSEGRITEEGAELIGSFHTKWLELAREFGLAMISRMEPDLYEREGLDVQLSLHERPDIRLSRAEFKKLSDDMSRILMALADRAEAEIEYPDRPWEAKSSDKLDKLKKYDTWSVQYALPELNLISKRTGTGADEPLWKMLDFKLVNDEVAPLDEMNFLGLLCKVRGGQRELLSPDFGCLRDGYRDELEIFRCAEGCQTLAKKMAEKIQTKQYGPVPATVRRLVAVKYISLSKSGVTLGLKATDGRRFVDDNTPFPATGFSHVILAIPPSVWSAVTITADGKDADPAKEIGQMRMNEAVKYFSDMKERFWIKRKAAPYGGAWRLGQVWEGTDNQTRIGKQGILLSVFAGPVSGKRRAPTRDDFERNLPLLYPGYAENLNKRPPPLLSDWPNVPFIKTGYWTPYPGEIFRVGEKLTRPYHDRLFFAGEHTQTDFFGYMEGALRSGERAAETLMLQACGLLEKPAPKPSAPVRVALAASTRESAAFEREVAAPFKMRASSDASEGKSPFLGRDLFAGEAAAEWEPRVAALVAESPFVNALEELGGGFDLGQLQEEEAVDELDDEEEWEASEAWEEPEEEELIPPADQAEDESVDESAADVESASLREDEARLDAPGGFVAGEGHLERFSDYSADELSLDGEREWEHSELEEDFDPDLEGEKASLAPLGRSDFWPDVVYIVKEKDSFLNAAREFHKLWGLKHVEFESFETLIGLIAKAKSPEKRIRVISHAWDGFKIPLFSGSPAGFLVTQKQIEALNAGDGALMDELLGTLVDLDQTTDQGFVVWNALLSHVESNSPAALKPFGLTSKTKPSGDEGLLLRRCADLVAVASANPVFEKAIRKSIAGAQDRLKRTKAEVDALEAAVRGSGFTFTISPPSRDMVDRLRAAVDALDKRKFRATMKAAREKLKGKWLDFRGCRIGHKPKYLEALAILMGTDGCTAPDWWSGYPGEAPVSDKQVSSVGSFKGLVDSSPAAEAAMNRWGAREVTGWSSVAAAGKPGHFFDEFLVAQNGVLPVYEVDYSGAAPKEKHTLYWNSDKGKERWLGSMWDRAPKKQVRLIARAWGAKTPRMAALALQLKVKDSTQANPQNIFVVPEPEFRDHIIEVKKP
jgi:monoamine oxidase